MIYLFGKIYSKSALSQALKWNNKPFGSRSKLSNKLGSSITNGVVKMNSVWSQNFQGQSSTTMQSFGWEFILMAPLKLTRVFLWPII